MLAYLVFLQVGSLETAHMLGKVADFLLVEPIRETALPEVHHLTVQPRTFTFGPYSTDEVLDVTYVEFPRLKAQVVVHIGEDNAVTEYQLFYLTDGELINARNVTNMSDILGANTFL